LGSFGVFHGFDEIGCYAGGMETARLRLAGVEEIGAIEFTRAELAVGGWAGLGEGLLGIDGLVELGGASFPLEGNGLGGG
jgi:hypothetical protein